VYTKYYKDSEKTNAAGRFGDALGALYLDRIGFPMFAHFEDLDFRPSVHPRPTKSPDFVFFNRSLSEARLLECKGSATAGNSATLVRKVEHDAMKGQIMPWLGLHVHPAASRPPIGPISNGWAIGTYVTQHSSWLYPYPTPTTVSPPAHTHVADIDAVRIHYVRWLKMMGARAIPQALMGLAEAQEELRQVPMPFLQFNFAGRNYLSPLSNAHDGLFELRFTIPHAIPTLIDDNVSGVVLGLQERLMRTLLAAARNSNPDEQAAELVGLREQTDAREQFDASQGFDTDSETVSLFGDGSIAFRIGTSRVQFLGAVLL
jgi:hypothetical protein